MKIAVPTEVAAGESRVALVPDVVRKLTAAGHEVAVQRGAGDAAGFPDAAYEKAGATLTDDPWSADLVVKVAPPSVDEAGKLGSGSTLIGFLAPRTNAEGLQALAKSGATCIAMEAVPRISRAQAMDALSSQATVGGYQAVVIAAHEMQRFFPMLMTAAGTIPPAQVLVLGAGVAGLQAIATSRRLGAVVTGYDVRAAAAEQVESLGAKFLKVDVEVDGEGTGGYAKEVDAETQAKQAEALAVAIGKSDVVITTALVPGKPAPKLVTADAVSRMKPGSVIVDLAGEAGGNAEPSKWGERVVTDNGVVVLAPVNLPSTMAEHASSLYARNVQALVELLAGEDGALAPDFEDEIVKGAAVVRGGEVKV